MITPHLLKFHLAVACVEGGRSVFFLILEEISPFVGPHFGLLAMCPLGFKASMDSLICARQRCPCYIPCDSSLVQHLLTTLQPTMWGQADALLPELSTRIGRKCIYISNTLPQSNRGVGRDIRYFWKLVMPHIGGWGKCTLFLVT